MSPRDATTFEELLSRPREAGDGATVAAARGVTSAQGAIRVALGGILWHAFGRPAQPGTGWWFASGVEIQSGAEEAWCPDLAGFRRRRGEPAPAGLPIRARPDWVCEIVCPAPADADEDRLARLHRRLRIPHLWIADTGQRTLDVYRWTESGYEGLSRAGTGATVRAAPFKEIAIAIDEIFADAG